MTAITRTAARENLSTTMDRVCSDHDPVIITRNRDQAVVMLSIDDDESLQETACLLRSPADTERLLASIDSLNRGNGIKKRIKDLVPARIWFSRLRRGRVTSIGCRPTGNRSNGSTS